MFEKEAEEYQIRKHHQRLYGNKPVVMKELNTTFKDAAEFGYNKANEWHYVKDGDYPKEKGNYLVAWKRTHHVEEYGEWGFDVDLFNADEGYFEGVGDYVIAWKEIILPKENEFKTEMFPKITLPKGSAEFVDKVIADAEKRLKENE